MITLGVFWIKNKYNGTDCGGFIYWGTVFVDFVGLINTASVIETLV